MQAEPDYGGSKCSSCKDPVFGSDSVTLCLECTDAIQALLTERKPGSKCATEGLQYLERDVQALAVAARRAKRVIHKNTCKENKCCDDCLLLGGTLERFFYDVITEE